MRHVRHPPVVGLPAVRRLGLAVASPLGAQPAPSGGAPAALVVSGPGSAIAVPDLWFLMARSPWVTRREELDALLPPAGGLVRRIADFLRYAL